MYLESHDLVATSAGDWSEPETLASEEERQAFIHHFQDVLRCKDDPLGGTVELPGFPSLQFTLHRRGKASAVVWSADASPVAASVLLMGEDGANDVGVVECLRQDPTLPFAPDVYNGTLAKNRPCVAKLYLDGKWFQNGRIDLVAMSLAVASIAAPAAVPTLKLKREPTPEEAALLQKRLDEIFEVFRLIQSEWFIRGKLFYVVRASERVRGRSIAEIRQVRFWTGIDGKGGRQLDVDQLASVFIMLRDYHEQIGATRYLREPTTGHKINLARDDSELAEILSGIQITEPPTKKPRRGGRRGR